MSLFSVPFYPSLVGKEIDGVKLTTVYVLLIGAIIAHSNGKFNCCVASPEVLAEEIGSTEKNVKDYRSALIRVGIIEPLERDRSNYITSMRVNGDVLCKLLAENSESDRKAFPNFGKPFPKKWETKTEVVTGVGDNNNRKEDQEDEGAGGRMKPAVLYSRVKAAYHIRKDADKKGCLRAIEKLQDLFDDETIINAANHFYSVDRIRPQRFENGLSWWPDFFWFLDNTKTDVVARKIKGVSSLFRDEEKVEEQRSVEYNPWEE